MRGVYRAKQVREMDLEIIHKLGMPAHTLMEIAGKGAADLIHHLHPHEAVHIFCGAGNNGGDGYVIARWLALWGHIVHVSVISPPKTESCTTNHSLCEAVPRVYFTPPKAPCPVVIDAMLGTGQDRAPAGKYASGCQEITRAQERGSHVYSLDLPTGRDPDTGSPMGDAYITPDSCITFGKLKRGLFRNFDAGSIYEIDIGLDLAPSPSSPEAFLIEESDIEAWWPQDDPSSAKWNRGHVAVIARGGAAVLAAHGAFAAGAGLVSIVCDQTEWASLPSLRPEVMRADKLDPERHDAVVFGPGIERWPDLQSLWEHFPKPMVFDAGGLNLLAQLESVPKSQHTRILTPHSAEAARLLNCERAELEKDPFSAVEQLNDMGFAVLKGPYTKFGSNPICINPSGNHRLATAGSGDILAGMIGAFLSKSLSERVSCALACFIHGKAGEEMGYAESATDLLSHIHASINQRAT